LGRTCGTHGEKTNEYRCLVGKLEGKRLLEIPRLGGRMVLKWILRNRMG
jgi:hypothetical protein